ncbi:reverse transcriptase domain-containing protein [Tanacetum coccineum]|uniref:Reverse transcriptase domain-containing protein n=1 Tax=Tanacetum coccineum TaxID=301880 RepID=A0ABQ4XJ41_9ASTR
MQILSGKLVTLKRFLSGSAERSLPFFDTLKDITKENKDEYRWTEDAEKAFQEMKKVIMELPLLTTPRKEETIYVYLAAVEKAILNKAQSSGKLAKYSVELRTYNITYDPRNAIKGQVLADFLLEAPVGIPTEEFFRLPEKVHNKDSIEKWTLFTDGASNSKGFGVGLVLISPSDMEFTYALRLDFTSINNKAEYEALLAGLRLAAKMKVHAIDIKANILSKLATHVFDHLTKEVLVEVLSERLTDRREVSAIVEEDDDNWMTPIIQCLAEGVWPEDKDKRRSLRMKTNQYVLEEGVLFNKGYPVPMLRCVGPSQVDYVIKEIHIGSCGMHIGARSVVAKAIIQGYYWPTMHKDAFWSHLTSNDRIP